MKDHPEVKITKLEPEVSCIPNANFGVDGTFQTDMNDLLAKLAKSASELFLPEWEGNKIPRGASLNGKSIAWTQHGRVMSVDSEFMGTYERLVEFGGDSKQEQKMIVALF